MLPTLTQALAHELTMYIYAASQSSGCEIGIRWGARKGRFNIVKMVRQPDGEIVASPIVMGVTFQSAIDHLSLIANGEQY